VAGIQVTAGLSNAVIALIDWLAGSKNGVSLRLQGIVKTSIVNVPIDFTKTL
jgi:hypothetical protein